jgi:2-methylcitrate dehydratase PrpD
VLFRSASIRVDTFAEAARLGTRLPQTTEEAQFNLAWPIAAMLVDGEVGPRQMLEERLSDPVLRDVASRVEVYESAELTELCRLLQIGDPRGRFGSKVTITCKDGHAYHSGLMEGTITFPPADWDDASMEEKFRWLAGFVLPPALIDRVVEMVWHFEDLAGVRDLTRLLA